MSDLTHGLKIINQHEGVMRVMSLQRYADADGAVYAITIDTTHPGDDAPIKTKLTLSAYGYAMFCLFMSSAPAALENFEIVNNGQDAP
jgi:hypothetical protein